MNPRLDVTSALFLDLHHARLPHWASLTTGIPAALRESEHERSVAATVADMHRVPAGITVRSSLHALVDVFRLLPRPGDTVAVDEGTYSVLQWAANTARDAGARVYRYPHLRPDGIDRLGTGRLWIATDGWCGGCNHPAPIPHLQNLVRARGGGVVVDDTLAWGILGCPTARGTNDGSGTPRWLGTDHDQIVWVASFAKALGTPITVLTGKAETVARLAKSGSRLHGSPPSAPEVAAAEMSLRSPRGLARRRRMLWANVHALRRALALAAVPLVGRPFPILNIPVVDPHVGYQWWTNFRTRGVDALVREPHCCPGAQITVVVRAGLSPTDIATLVDTIAPMAPRIGVQT
ncbi:hypothetical protein [Prescottella agglutinans]|uniref:hypothetical protein n=1 Tax=Prescottella agglutinans TaxID=1644129 RepID=UPI003D9634CE